MEPTVVRHRRSPSSDRFLSAFPFSPTTATFSISDELHESDLFFTNTNNDDQSSTRHAPGILHALSPRAPLLSSAARSIPRPPQRISESAAERRVPRSAPMNVPMKGRDLAEMDGGDVEEEMLPPHEIVARSSFGSVKTTRSVLEGAGRTLKGRDLRQVRNAVWRQTGFLD